MQPLQEATGRRPEPEQPIRHRISNFLAATVSRFRIILLVILVVAAAFMVGYFIYTEVSRKLANDSTLLAEGAQDLYDKWQGESDAAQKGALQKQLMDQLGVLIGRYPHQYGGQRGLFIRANVYYANKDWDNAQKDYSTLARRFPASYLAPISLFDAAVCLEEKGDAATALTLYTEIPQRWPDSPVAPRALFDAGRLDEQKGSFDEARKMYDQVDSQYPTSLWDKLARDREIELRVMGKIK